MPEVEHDVKKLDSKATNLDVSNIESDVLKRLIKEIQNGNCVDTTRAFDRIHNRHNRS